MRGVFASIFGLTLLAACSPVPIAGTWPVSVEQRMQSVSHWQMLANETVVEAMQQGALPPVTNAPVSVYVALSDRGELCPFCMAFNGYLKTALEEHHYYPAPAEVAGIPSIHFDVQTVQFLEWKDHEAIPGLFTTLGFGAWLGTQAVTHWGGGLSSAVAGTAIPAGAALDVAHMALATPTDSEVIVTVKVERSSDHLELWRKSNNFYVAGADLWHYEAPAREAPGTIHPRVVGYNVYE